MAEENEDGQLLARHDLIKKEFEGAQNNGTL
jgi:hypothetical protein